MVANDKSEQLSILQLSNSKFLIGWNILEFKSTNSRNSNTQKGVLMLDLTYFECNYEKR